MLMFINYIAVKNNVYDDGTLIVLSDFPVWKWTYNSDRNIIYHQGTKYLSVNFWKQIEHNSNYVFSLKILIKHNTGVKYYSSHFYILTQYKK